ncbi:hypothetical protein AWB67_05424 [Caballeronia terrestris]|uniref:Uncharacterized protein n=1 Tax=Caballeronia terrestris TaxID=1226301 RepID=A0A158KE27_9BURK|nr:hypothetical protein AWB67_05424 [Caballeronia terrestris]
MMKTEFLRPGGAADRFCDWLATRLPELDIHLKFATSKAVPGGLDVKVRGIEEVLQRYYWNAKFTNRHGKTIVSHDWESTRQSLHELGNWLRASVDAGDETAAATAAFAILEWGGVSSARPFIERKRDEGRLCAYLSGLAPLFSLDGEVDTDQLTAENVERFDSGMTKIHAIFDTTGSPIYDSRVGAALAMLFAIFRHETESPQQHVENGLLFPSGEARGDQVRNPGELGLGLLAAPQFYTGATPKHVWARWQVQTGWIIQSVLQRNPQLFASLESLDDRDPLAARCHAFEASLFMIGYDLRCLAREIDPDAGAAVHATAAPAGPIEPVAGGAAVRTGRMRNSVPIVHPFKTVIVQYLGYRESEQGDASDDAFRQWLTNHPNKENAATAENFTSYRYPLEEREFDCHDRSLEHVRLIAAGGEEGLRVANGGDLEFVPSDEREKVCLLCAGLTGCVYRRFEDGASRAQQLIASGAAGSRAAANNLLSVGRAIGTHFGLLDGKFKPTQLFNRFFGDDFCAGCFD